MGKGLELNETVKQIGTTLVKEGDIIFSTDRGHNTAYLFLGYNLPDNHFTVREYIENKTNTFSKQSVFNLVKEYLAETYYELYPICKFRNNVSKDKNIDIWKKKALDSIDNFDTTNMRVKGTISDCRYMSGISRYNKFKNLIRGLTPVSNFTTFNDVCSQIYFYRKIK